MANAAVSSANLSATESVPAPPVAPAKRSRAKIVLPALIGVAAVVGTAVYLHG